MKKIWYFFAAAVELDAETSRLCSKLQHHHDGEGNTLTGGYATFALGFAIFPDGHWSALLPTSPLRRFQILKIMNLYHSNNQLVSIPVTINEQVLHYLVGLAYSETDISGIIQEPSKLVTLEIEKIARDKTLYYYHDNVTRLLKVFKRKKKKNTKESDNNSNYNLDKYSRPVIILSGGDEIDGLIIAQEVCTKLGLHLKYLNAENIPTKNEDLQQLIQSWTRDAILLGMGLFISHKNSSVESQNQILQSLKIFVENIPTPVFIHHTSQMIENITRPYNIVNLKKPSKKEQIHVWKIFIESLFKILQNR